MIKKGEIIKLEIVDYAFVGKGIAKLKIEDRDYIVFVQHGIKGQIVNVKINKRKPKYAEGSITEIIQHSPLEKTTQFQPISGAPYINLPIEEQKKMKLQVTKEVFTKIGKIKDIDSLFDQWISSPSNYHYRNKMEYSFSSIGYNLEKEMVEDDVFSLGFKRKGTWWMVENLDADSGLFDQELDSKLSLIRNHLYDSGLPAWHPPKKEGFFRHLVVRKSFSNNQLLFNLVTSSKSLNKFDISSFGNYLQKILGERMAGLIHTTNDDVADREKLDKGSSKLIIGNSTIKETINGLNFEISMQSFFQTNPLCAEKLYQKVIDYLLESDIPKDQIIMDLFCGTGTIGQLIAKHTKNKVVGVDIVASSIENAKKNVLENSQKNNLSELTFICADVGKFLLNNPEYQNKIHSIVIDPPRAGIAPKTLRKVIRLNAKVIIYVSCNPGTQARDLITLNEMGYELQKFSLVDQFPHTSHIESIMLFKKSLVETV